MNYIKEINAFYDWLETNSVSSSTIVLWHALMAINNKTGWKPEFAVAMSTLEIKTSLSKKTVERARNNLKTKGLIDWRSRKGNKSAIYKMYSVQDILWGNNDAQSVPQPVAQSVSQGVPQSVAITKHKQNINKTEQQQAHTRKNPFAFFEQNFGFLSSFISESVGQWIDDMSEELVLEAMKIALKRGNRNFHYCEGILRDWQNKGYSSVEDVKRDEQQSFPQRKKKDNIAAIEEWFAKNRSGVNEK